MADYEQKIERLEDALGEIENSLAGTEEISRAFRGEMEDMGRSMARATSQAQGLTRTVGSSLKTAFDDLIFDGRALSDVLSGLGRNIASRTFSKAITPVSNALGGAVETGVQSLISGLLPFANGGVLSRGQVSKFASGGVVNGATAFGMRGGLGVMGEAGPEAIMPLARGADGKLGVRGGGGAVNVTINITTPDIDSFQKSRGQIASQLSRAVARGNKNL
jgi:phage-related minor tail protein